MTVKIKIEQAVVLCGGLGTRLRPFTDQIPKPMVRLNNRPFLDYLLDQMLDNGIKRVLLLTGYLSDKIVSHYGTQYKSLEISYSQGDVSLDTAERIEHAADRIDDYFLLMYSDNYSPFILQHAVGAFDSEQSLRLHLSEKPNGNISMGEKDKVSQYDPNRAEAANYVELGYMLVNKSRVFRYLTAVGKSFTQTIVKCVNDASVTAQVNQQKYYSISDPERLKLTEKYLCGKPIILIDRDGVINVKAPKAEYITRPEDFVPIPETLKAMKALASQGFQFVIISNQAGVGRGVFTQQQLDNVNNKLRSIMSKEEISILDIYTCIHSWNDGCECRKPKPGMLIDAAIKYQLRLDKTLFIGDDVRDVQAAINAGCKSTLVNFDTDLLKSSGIMPDYSAAYLSLLIDDISSFYNHTPVQVNYP
jgi:histidinol-phosphate phosphatase family protein